MATQDDLYPCSKEKKKDKYPPIIFYNSQKLLFPYAQPENLHMITQTSIWKNKFSKKKFLFPLPEKKKNSL